MTHNVGNLQAKTAAHYNAYPFEFLTPADEIAIRDMQPLPFVRFVETHVGKSDRVAEIGCGPGRAILFLCGRGVDVTAVDISYQSLILARTRAPEANFVLSTNLALPFRDDAFDIVLSDGVIHHTPNARSSFNENVRILKTGGLLYLGLYNRRRYYYYIYTYIGAPIRLMNKTFLGSWLIHITLIPAYWFVHLLKSRGKRTWRGAVNFFYDYIATPRASFHTYEEVLDWARQEGLQLLEYDSSLGNVHVFVLQKSYSKLS